MCERGEGVGIQKKYTKGCVSIATVLHQVWGPRELIHQRANALFTGMAMKSPEKGKVFKGCP